MVQKLTPLPPSVTDKPEASRWFTQVQQLMNTALGGTNGYYTAVPVAASTVVIPSNVSSVLLRPAGVLATLTVQLPGAVPDGTIVRIVSSQAVTALTTTGVGAPTIIGAPASLAANIGIAFQFMAVNAANGIATPTWQRLH
jgi:hypothetical protein